MSQPTLTHQPPRAVLRTQLARAVAIERSHRFWRAFNAWSAQASDDEAAQLEQALQPHAPHVRPIQVALREAMADPQAAAQLPVALVVTLRQHGWADTKALPRLAA